MQNEIILTPFFLDILSNGLLALGQSGFLRQAQVNQPAFNASDSLEQHLAALLHPIADFSAAALARGNRPVSIAGDCLTAIGMFGGIQRAGLTPTLLWLDAHGDFNTPETSPSGCLEGMPLAMLAGRGNLTLPQALGLKPIPENHILLCDGRDLDPAEKLALNNAAVSVTSTLNSLLKHPLLDNPLYIHLDPDILSLEEAPAMNFPSPGGISAAELQAFLHSLVCQRQVIAISVAGWNPSLDNDGRTQETCLQIIETLIATP